MNKAYCIRQNLYIEILSYHPDLIIPRKESFILNETLEYKFYTKLWYKLKRLSIVLGLDIRPICVDMKKALIKDGHFENKSSSEIKSGIFNQLVIIFISFSFIITTKKMANIHLEFIHIFLVGLCQSFGIAFYLAYAQVMKNQRFSSFSKVFEFTYSFKSQLLMKVETASILQNLDFSSLQSIKNQRLSIIIEQLQLLIKKNMKLGEDITLDLGLLIEDTWDLLEYNYEEFLKALSILRVFVLLFFFLIPYFYIIYILLTKIGEQL